MFAKRRLSVALAAVVAGAGWAVFVAPGSQVAAAPAQDGTTVRASVHDGTNAQAPDSSYHSQVSGDGTQVAFVGQDNLTDEYDNGCCTNAIYVRDLTTGRTVQISVGTEQLPSGALAPNGDAPNGSSDYPSLSANGRYVSFVTRATNIVPHDKAFPWVIVVCDRDPNNDGVFDQQRPNSPPGVLDYRFYEIADVNNITDNRFPDGFDGWPHLSGDGGQIVWGDTNQNQHLVKTAPLEQQDGSIGSPSNVYTLPTTLGNQTGGQLDQPQISGDGSFIVARWTHVSTVTTTGIVYTELSSAGSPNGLTEIDASDTVPGTFQGGGDDANPPTRAVELPDISDFGQVAVFDSYPVNDDSSPQAYSVAPFGAEDPQTFQSTLISGEAGGGEGDGLGPVVSADGRYVAFVTDRGGVYEGAEPSSPPGATCINDSGEGLADDAAPCQIVVRDLVVDQERAAAGKSMLPAELASASRTQDCASDLPPDELCPGDYDSTIPSMSDDGAQVTFDSDADDLVPGDTNRICDEECQEECYVPVCGSPARDVFVRTWTPGLLEPNLHMGHVHVGNSKGVRYTITATGFGPQTISGVTVAPLTGSGFSVDDTDCRGSPNFPFVLHEGETCDVTVLFAPTQQGTARGSLDVATSSAASDTAAIITGTGTPPHTAKVLPHEIVRTSVGDGDPGTQADHGSTDTSMVSGNGDYDVFVSTDPLDGRPTEGYENVFVRNLRTDTTQQISLGGTETGPNTGVYVPDGTSADNDSFEPTISADGRFVSFVTDASNVAGQGDEDEQSVVVCDRDPDGDGVFDERQPNHPDRPAFRCIDAQQVPSDFEMSQDPRLAPDGRHLVMVACTKVGEFECDGARVIQVVQLRTTAQGLQPIAATDRLNLTLDQFGIEGERMEPQISDQGLSDDPHGVRVAYAASEGDVSAIFVVDVFGGQSGSPRRIDRNPGGSGFLGDDDGPTVGDPSMTDEGLKVAFDYENYFNGGTARVYVANVDPEGRATTRAIHTDGLRGPLARGSDPALSGDGRYISYVTDSPNFDNTAPVTPDQSCLVAGDGEEVVPADVPSATCQIVARDLVLDAQRSHAGLPPLPDALVTESASTCTVATVFGSTCGGDADSDDPSMSTIGSEVGFDSYADDLVPKDTNGLTGSNEEGGQDAFVRTFFPKAALTPVHLGKVPVGSSATRSSTLTITGFGPYQLSTATFGGADPGDFSVSGGTCSLPGQVLHLGQMCDLLFTFKPGALGPRSATATVSGDNNPNTTTITVTGTGANTSGAMFSATPDPVKFGSGLPLDRPGRTRLLQITNTGGSPLILSQISVIDSSVPGAALDYTVDVSACTLGTIQPGHTCKVLISWVGHAVGPRPATLRVVDNAPGGIQVVNLRATVPAPKIALSPSVVATGHLTQVSGTGFAPDRRVLVTLPDNAGSAIATTTRHGRFSAPLILFPNGVTGPSRVLARSAHADASIKAGKKFLITLGTLESPTLVIRH